MITSPTRLEILRRRVSLAQIHGRSKRKNVNVIGCECSKPRVGVPYRIFLGRGQIFSTTPIVEMKASYAGLMFKTRNSTYRLTYLKTKVASQAHAYPMHSMAG